MTERLERVASEFNAARAEATDLRKKLDLARQRVMKLRPEVAGAIVEAVRKGSMTQVEISRATGYTAERIRQICREAGVDAPK